MQKLRQIKKIQLNAEGSYIEKWMEVIPFNTWLARFLGYFITGRNVPIRMVANSDILKLADKKMKSYLKKHPNMRVDGLATYEIKKKKDKAMNIAYVIYLNKDVYDLISGAEKWSTYLHELAHTDICAIAETETTGVSHGYYWSLAYFEITERLAGFFWLFAATREKP
jgi:hypothetical protein